MDDFLNKQSKKRDLNLLKIGKGTYKIGHKVIKPMIRHGKMVVRVGGGYMIISDYLDEFLAKSKAGEGTPDPTKMMQRMRSTESLESQVHERSSERRFSYMSPTRSSTAHRRESVSPTDLRSRPRQSSLTERGTSLRAASGNAKDLQKDFEKVLGKMVMVYDEENGEDEENDEDDNPWKEAVHDEQTARRGSGRRNSTPKQTNIHVFNGTSRELHTTKDGKLISSPRRSSQSKKKFNFRSSSPQS
mmetsp:Transcript_52410/g.59911  ORF Transcript_52410/g.59911 Transcript_52410/m.59911 type:complete len:245 (+) Transcript_52410:1322-2056(+)